MASSFLTPFQASGSIMEYQYIKSNFPFMEPVLFTATIKDNTTVVRLTSKNVIPNIIREDEIEKYVKEHDLNILSYEDNEIGVFLEVPTLEDVIKLFECVKKHEIMTNDGKWRKLRPEISYLPPPPGY